MNASSTPVVLRSSRFALLGGLAPVLVFLALALHAAAGRTASQEPVAAVWKAQQLDFTYRGYEAVYPCSVLQQRIALMLNVVGARPDLEVIVNDCDGPFASATVPLGNGPDRPAGSMGPGGNRSVTFATGGGSGWTRTSPASATGYARRSEPQQVAQVSVRLSMPAEMTPEVIAELQTDRKRRELITRVTGNPLPLFDNPIPFAAHRQVVTLSRETAGVEAADCELLEQMVRTVFRELGVRVVRRGYTCDRSYASRIAPTLDVEALVPVALEVEAPETPAMGGDPTDAPESRDEAEDEAQATGADPRSE